VAPQALIMSDAEDFSMATLPTIQLTLDDLARGDAVELVIEGSKDDGRAGIVTRLGASHSDAVARAHRR